jgi:vacuolar protein sorting-associated protein 33A
VRDMVNSLQKPNGVDTESIKANSLKDLLDMVDSVRGKKALILDPSLTGPLGLVVKFPVLRDHGIGKVYHLEPNPLTVTHDKLIYLCRPLQRNAEIILGKCNLIFPLTHRRPYSR